MWLSICGNLLAFVHTREVGVSLRNVVSRTFPHFSQSMLTPMPWFRILWNELYGVLYHFIYAVYWLGINTNVISWYRTILGHVWSAYFIQYRFDLHSEVIRFAGHTIGPLCLRCRWIAQQPTALTIWLIRRWWEAEPLPFCFHSPIMCTVCPSVFPRKCAYCHSRGW